ncbi:hypothetical protein D3C80_1231690 [compost metagenome]
MFELETIQALAQLGVTALSQEPLGPYNVDLFIEEGAVAVEIYSTHPGRERMADLHQRTEYLLNRGVSVLIVQINYPRRVFSMPDVCVQILAFTEFVRRNKTAGAQYGVVRGDGKIAAASSHHLNNRPAVVAF